VSGDFRDVGTLEGVVAETVGVLGIKKINFDKDFTKAVCAAERDGAACDLECRLLVPTPGECRVIGLEPAGIET
jgi:hypothetical protein